MAHGLSVAIIERPENYVTLIDLGSSDEISPLQDLGRNKSLRPDILYITHPHADHLSDIETALHPLYCPDAIHMQEYDWADVIKRERPRLVNRIDKLLLLEKKVPRGDYRGNANLKVWRYTPEAARQKFSEASYVNNSSLFLIYQWRRFKIAIAGDQERDVLDAYLKSPNFRDSASNADILIPPHHGHASSFPTLWPGNVGKPYVSIISVTDGDEHVDSRYSSPDFAKGISFYGEKRFALTTRQDGNISVLMRYGLDGSPQWEFIAS